MLLLLGQRQKVVEAALLEQRVAAGQQEAVRVAVGGEADTGLGLVDADADRPDHLLAAQLGQRPIGAVHGDP